MNRLITIITLLLVLVFYGSFLTHKINLVTADLGRHIKNGEMIINGETKVLTTNFYSYTYPDFPVVNHHWLTGVIFYLVWKYAGFSGLEISFIIVSLLTFLIFYDLARRKAGTVLPSLLSLLVIPIFAQRTEIRPEAFSYLFAGVFLWVLSGMQTAQNLKKTLAGVLILAITQILWVNTHVFFFLGPVIILVFLIESFFAGKIKSYKFKRLVVVLSVVILASLVNPFGFTELIYPFTIFQNYGYQLVENQTVWFIEKLAFNPAYLFLKVVTFLTIGSFILGLIKTKKFSVSILLFAVGFAFMAFIQNRNLPLFGLFALYIISCNLKLALGFDKLSAVSAKIKTSVPAIIFITLLVYLVTNLFRLFPFWHEFGLGLEIDNENAARFIKENNLSGPIFNNYDIGGYLIYYLYPENKVFVDNRPAEYPPGFFEDIYIPMQWEESVWEESLKKYQFNTIIFCHLDATVWGQKFLFNRSRDPAWKQIYKDRYTVIFSRIYK